MVELEEAVARILAIVPPAQPEILPLNAVWGRVLAQQIFSQADLPPFDNSAMDGYATRAEDIRTATAAAPVRLKIAGKAAAGELFEGHIAAGTCVRVFTGSALPAGATCVVMQEDARVCLENPDQILILDPARPWENVRLRGEDFRAGEPLGLPGQILSAGRLALLGAGGLARVAVGRQPTVGILATGSELQEPGTPLAPGQIYESNRLGLAALIRGAGANPVSCPLVGDNLEAIVQALSEAVTQCDLVVTVGGASVGDLDLIKPALAHLNAQLDFWKVAIKPGRPFLFGRANGKPIFGLPGNPVSALVTFLLLVRPALRRWQGATQTALPSFSGRLCEDLANPGTRRHFVRVRLSGDGLVSSAGTQASHLLSSFAAAQGLVDVPPQTTLPAGSSISVLVWEL